MTTSDPKLARLALQALRARDRYFASERQRMAVASALTTGRYDALSSHPEVMTKSVTAYRAWIVCEKAYTRYVKDTQR
ncbi:hypothetical protein [Curtobacterium herbarum]|uniref:Uncharacterized protein n=1 Tax=Curtobacterium herbarum TaxID=150122 RepID=A0ABP4K701_9MICO|nr:hypothetical protein [Curtobacterium herbarum]MBM7474910.1 hypothetical protein [Curtobacterium herbarum]MCS6545556.1 hypothetical protein [Curtobacterium herbarum]